MRDDLCARQVVEDDDLAFELRRGSLRPGEEHVVVESGVEGAAGEYAQRHGRDGARIFQCPCGVLAEMIVGHAGRGRVFLRVVLMAAEFIKENQLIELHARELLEPMHVCLLDVGPVTTGGGEEDF